MLWSLNKFSQLILKEMYRDQSGDFVCGYWSLRWLTTVFFPNNSVRDARAGQAAQDLSRMQNSR